MDSLELAREWKICMRFVSWIVKSLYRERELAKYKLHLVAVKGIRWDEGGSQPPDDCTFSMAMEMLDII
jgi:hypothetical protein